MRGIVPQVQYGVSSDGNPGLKDGAESRHEGTAVYVLADQTLYNDHCSL